MRKCQTDTDPSGTMWRVTGWLVGVGVLACGASLWWYESSLAEARRAVAAGRFADARPRLARLASWWPGRADVEFSLGVCEQATGRLDAAIAAWSRIPPSSKLAEDAALKRGEAEMDRGRLVEAEAVFQAALRRPGPRAVEIRHDLMQLFWQQGRLDEARALIERNWDEYRRTLGPGSAQAIANLRAHLSLDLEVYAIDHVQAMLDRAGAGRAGRPPGLAGSGQPGGPLRQVRRGTAVARSMLWRRVPTTPSCGRPRSTSRWRPKTSVWPRMPPST